MYVVDGSGIDDPDPGRVALVDAPACEIVIVVGGMLPPDMILFVVVVDVLVEDGLILSATPASAALAAGSGSA